jgi:hypothetical protein
LGGCRGRDRMVVGFTTIYAISAYHHWCCEFESQSGQGVQHYVIKFSVICDRSVYNWNIVESGVKHHQTYKQTLWIDFLAGYRWVRPLLYCRSAVFCN